MVIVSILPHAEFGQKDHLEDAPHFILMVAFVTVFSSCPGVHTRLLPCQDHVKNEKTPLELRKGAFYSIRKQVYIIY